MTRGRPFRPGQSGNAAGKPRGARNRITLAAEQLLDGEAANLTRKCVELALRGDPCALRLCMERILPAPKDRPIRFPIPAASTAREINLALAKVTEAVGAGVLTPLEATNLAALFEVQRKAIETTDLEERIRELEKGQGERGRR